MLLSYITSLLLLLLAYIAFFFFFVILKSQNLGIEMMIGRFKDTALIECNDKGLIL